MTLIDAWPKLRAQLIIDEGDRRFPYLDSLGVRTAPACWRDYLYWNVELEES